MREEGGEGRGGRQREGGGGGGSNICTKLAQYSVCWLL